MGNAVPTGKVKRQHTVSATYLRKFSRVERNGKYIVCAFNKQTNKIIETQPISICKLNEFYETVEEEQVLERVFCNFEEKYNILYSELIGGADTLNEDCKDNLSKFIALQLLRTEQAKVDLKVMPKSLLETDGPNIEPTFKKEVEEFLNPEKIRGFNKNFILKNFSFFSKILLEMKWILLVNKTRRPFWSSDNPVTFYNADKKGGHGLTSSGVQIYFPLSSKHCLIICDPRLYSPLPSLNEVDNSNIDFQRCLQVNNANHFIFSREKEFLMAHNMINENPNIAKPNRPTTKRVI